MSISQYLLESKEHFRKQVRLRNVWTVRVRWFYVTFLAGVAYLSSSFANNSGALRHFILGAFIAGVGLNAVFWLLLVNRNRSLRYYQVIAIGQIMFDAGLASAVVSFQGGLDSRATILYAIPIISKGILFDRAFAYAAALLCAASYTTTLVSYQASHPGAYALQDIWLPVIFYTVTFIVLAVLVSRFTLGATSNEREQSFSEMLAMLRHQLKHPSGVIAAIAEMLEHSPNYMRWPVKDKEYLLQLKRENKRLNVMLTNIIDATSEEVEESMANPVRTSLLMLVNEAVVSCAAGAKRMNDLQADLPHENIELDCNPHQLRTALDNVIENAFNYSTAGTPVVVGLAEDKSTGEITITITDQGQGMSPSEQKNLFKLFSKLDELPGRPDKDSQQLYAMGLGLYVCKVIVERQHGKMMIESKPGSGTKVTIKFRRK